MSSRRRVASLPAVVAAVVVVAVLAGACSPAPVSQVRTTAIPSTVPAPSASEAPASARPAVTDPPTTSEPAGPTPTPGIPPKPADVTFKKVAEAELNGALRRTSRLTWTSPEGVATSFKVYGVTKCLRASRKNQGKPCVVKGMRIPKDTLKLLATVPGTQRTVDVSWEVPQDGRGPYYAVLVRATNEAGDSIFTIAWSAKV